MNEYWVYENWVVRQATIHNGSCGNCQQGKGKHGATTTEHGRWHGPCASMDTTDAAARQTGQPVRRCGLCNPTSRSPTL